MSAADLLDAELERFELRLQDLSKDQLRRYLRTLERWNRTVNLTGLEGRGLVRKLVVEPLWVHDQLVAGWPRGRYLDIGSGNGSPAIPWYVHGGFEGLDLVEARSRRATFLQQVVRQVGLRGATVHRGRFADLRSGLETPKWITLQGVRLTPELLDNIRLLSGRAALLVWFTREASSLLPPKKVLKIPFSDRTARVFQV